MRWTLYRWVWQLRSPLHIGLSPSGSLNRTRLYVPARTMWGALTAELARRIGSGITFPNYDEIGQTLRQHARFTYLYPAERVNGEWLAWLPRYEQNSQQAGLLWYREDEAVEPLLDRHFRKHLLHTQPSTAIAPSSDTAEEGTLREVEYISPYWRAEGMHSRDKLRPVAFVGYVFLKDTLSQQIRDLLTDIQELFVGGEIRYGFGHLVLLPFSESSPWEQINACFGFPVDLSQAEPQIECPNYLAAHGSLPASRAQGALETLVWWDWRTLQANNQPFWQPGTRIEQPEDRKLNLTIGNDGLWRS